VGIWGFYTPASTLLQSVSVPLKGDLCFGAFAPSAGQSVLFTMCYSLFVFIAHVSLLVIVHLPCVVPCVLCVSV